MPISIFEDDFALSPMVESGGGPGFQPGPGQSDSLSDDDIVVVEDHRAGLTAAILGMPPSQPYSPPVYFRVVSSSYVAQGDEMLMTRRVAIDSGFLEKPLD